MQVHKGIIPKKNIPDYTLFEDFLMNTYVRLLVGRSVYHNFLKRQESYTSHVPIEPNNKDI